MLYFLSNNRSKIIFIGLIGLISYFTVALLRYPIRSYELSIYDSIPAYVWGSFIFCIIISSGIIIYSAQQPLERKILIILSFYLLVLINMIIILILPIRGYLLSNAGDHASHIGFVIYILNSSHIFSDDIYPLLHILLASISILASLTAINVSVIASPVFYILFILGNFLLGRKLINLDSSILIALASTILLFPCYIYLMPAGFVAMLFPLVIYIFFMSSIKNNYNYSIILIISLFSIIVFHPVSSIFLIFLFSILFTSNYIIKHWPNLFPIKTPVHTQNYRIFALALSIVAWMLWIWNNNSLWQSSVMTFVGWFKSELFTASLLHIASESITLIGLSRADFFRLLVLYYGHIILLLIMSIVSIYFIFKKSISGIAFQQDLKILSFFFIITIGLWAIDIIRPLTNISSGRILYYVFSLLPLFAGLGFFLLITKLWKSSFIRNKILYVIWVIFIFSSMISIFSLYDSPLKFQYNSGVDYETFIGMKWLLKYGNHEIGIVGGGGGSGINRFSDAVNGVGFDAYSKFQGNLFDHFGYKNNTFIGQYIKNPNYLILRKNFIISVYKILYPKLGRYNERDFSKLEMDRSVIKIYNNGELINCYIKHLN